MGGMSGWGMGVCIRNNEFDWSLSRNNKRGKAQWVMYKYIKHIRLKILL